MLSPHLCGTQQYYIPRGPKLHPSVAQTTLAHQPVRRQTLESFLLCYWAPGLGNSCLCLRVCPPLQGTQQEGDYHRGDGNSAFHSKCGNVSTVILYHPSSSAQELHTPHIPFLGNHSLSLCSEVTRCGFHLTDSEGDSVLLFLLVISPPSEKFCLAMILLLFMNCFVWVPCDVGGERPVCLLGS